MGRRRCLYCRALESPEYIFYMFPKCPDRRKKWMEILLIDSDMIKPRSVICSRHFRPNQKLRFKLKKDALPFRADDTLTTPIRSNNKHQIIANNTTPPVGRLLTNSKPTEPLILPALATVTVIPGGQCLICGDVAQPKQPKTKLLDYLQCHKLIAICNKYLHLNIETVNSELQLVCQSCEIMAEELSTVADQMQELQSRINNIVVQFTLDIAKKREQKQLSKPSVTPRLILPSSSILGLPTTNLHDEIMGEENDFLEIQNNSIKFSSVEIPEDVLSDEVKIEYNSVEKSILEDESNSLLCSVNTPYPLSQSQTFENRAPQIDHSPIENSEVMQYENVFEADMSEVVLMDKVKVEYLEEDSVMTDENFREPSNQNRANDPLSLFLPDENVGSPSQIIKIEGGQVSFRSSDLPE